MTTAIDALDALAVAAVAVVPFLDPDDTHLRQVLQGLADDAAGYTPTGPLSNFRNGLETP
jgi:hypothetical protein